MHRLTKHGPRMAALALLAATPVFVAAQGPPDDDATEVESVITIRQAGVGLEFVNPDGTVCSGADCSFIVDASSPRQIRAIAWETDFPGEEVRGLRIRFKKGRTPFYRGNRNNARNHADLQGARRGRRFHARGRIKSRAWKRQGLRPILENGKEERFSYSVEVRTNKRRYFVDPIIIVRRGG